MQFSICSYSFHRLLEAGQQDMFKYITDSRELGAAYLEPWNSHLAPLRQRDDVIKAAGDTTADGLSADELAYLDRVKAAANEAGMPFGCLAVDGAHIYEESPEARALNRTVAYRWLEAADHLGAKQIRIDAGGPQEMPDDVFAIIVEGYNDLIPRAQDLGLELVVENHWGPTQVPENVLKLLQTIDGLGLLFDTNNWAEGRQQDGWEMCASYATATHIKTFEFDAAGNEPTVDLAKAINLLRESGYDGMWGIESCPTDGDEYGGVQKTMALIKRVFES